MLVDDKSLSEEGLGGCQCYLVLQEAAHFSGNGWLPTSNIQTCGGCVNFTALGGGWALQRASTKAVPLCKELWARAGDRIWAFWDWGAPNRARCPGLVSPMSKGGERNPYRWL